MSKCNEGIHKFRPRYDEESTGYAIETVRGVSAEDLRSLLLRKVYVKDVCVRCGKEVKK